MSRYVAPRASSAVLALLVLTASLLAAVVAAPSARAGAGARAGPAQTAVPAGERADAGTLDCAPDPLRCPPAPLFGAFLPAVPGATVDVAGLQRLGEALGTQPSVALSFQTFSVETDTASLRAVHAAHRLPMLTWEPWAPSRTSTNAYPLRDITAGRFDAYLLRQARAMATVGGPVALRLAHEMNGGWYPWGRGVNGNTDADYVAMFRHVHDLFDAAGADNVLWVWAPNVTEWHPDRDLVGLYPGDSYVDWVGLTGYFAYTWDRFDGLYRETLPHVDQVAPHKPIYVVETGVLPGPGRAAQIHDLVSGLLHTPRFIGVNWLEKDARAQGRPDWRVSDDPAARAALAAELSSPWFADAAHPGAPVLAAPLTQAPPQVTAATGASTMTGTLGTWRTRPESGQVGYTATWQRCSDASTGSCTPVGTPTTSASVAMLQGYSPVAADAGRLLRLRVTASNAIGATTAWSVPVPAAVPAPVLPVVEARDGALKVVFPPAPAGTTSWRLSVDGVARTLIPAGTTTTWLVPLVNGRTYSLTLAAVVEAATEVRSSSPVRLTAVPMTTPFTPYLRVEGSTATWKMPPVPLGAARWTLTVDGRPSDVPLSTATWTAAGLAPGRSHPWTLTAGAGEAAGRTSGATTPAVSGGFTPLATPSAPDVRPAATGAVLTFPSAPACATGWRLTVGTTTYRTSAGSLVLDGLGASPTTWTLRATNPTATSDAATGTLTRFGVGPPATAAVLHRSPPPTAVEPPTATARRAAR